MPKKIVAQVLKLALIGVVIVIAEAHALTQLLASLFYGVKLTGPVTYIAVALVARYIPARSAARVDPMVALRHE